MILETLKVLDIERVGNTDEGIQAGINQESLPFIFELVSKQLYSNPIGSIIREITSNCFDSHIEAGVTEPVIINKGYDTEEGYYIEFIDVGIGLSPDRIQDVYMNYFSSTKREDNTQIGAFGIGSKTPLAYADLFYIITISNGIKYEYILHRGESKPTLELLNESSTTDHNGTTIKIYMERNDVSRFQTELINQLTYFDNVWFKGWPISNDYDIYEGKYFKFRSDISQNYNNIHICIGKVRYPIDMNKVAIDKNYQNIPIAVKFNIGELKITPSREALRYDEEGIKLIKSRVDLAVQEVLDIFEEQNPEIEDLKAFEEAIKNDNPRITFDRDKNHHLYIWKGSGLSKNYKFKPLSGINIKKTPSNLFFMWKIIGTINYNGDYVERSYDTWVNNYTIIQGNYLIFNKEDRISKYTTAYIAEQKGKNLNIIQRKELEYDNVVTKLGLKTGNELGKAKTIMQYMKVINSIVKEKGGQYSDYRPSDEWVAAYKRSIIESSLAFIRKKNKKIFIRDITRGDVGREITEGELQGRTGILIYGFREDKLLLHKISNTVLGYSKSIIKAQRGSSGYIKREKAFMVIQIAQAVEKSVIGAKKTIYCKDFLNTKFLKKLETMHYLDESIRDLSFNSLWFRLDFLKDFKKDYDNLIFIGKYTGSRYERNYSLEYKEVYIESMLTPLRDFEKKHSHTNIPVLINHISTTISSDEEALEEFIKYLKQNKVRLENRYYLKSQKQLKYEAGVKSILSFIKNPIIQNNLLNYNLNQLENVKE